MSVIDNTMTSSTGLPSRAEMEDFLFHEANLLDEWRLDEWLELFEPDATYLVPPTDAPDAHPETSLFLIADNHTRLEARVKRLSSRNAHVEHPRSRTRRMISNVLVGNGPDPDTIQVRANFTIWRIRRQITDVYVGQYVNVVVRTADGFRFKRRRAVLDLDALRPSGKVSIIL